MNKNQIEGDWKQIKGAVKTRWGKLTDDDMTTIAGKKEKLLGKIQERYGYAADKATKEVDEFIDGQKKAKSPSKKHQS